MWKGKIKNLKGKREWGRGDAGDGSRSPTWEIDDNWLGEDWRFLNDHSYVLWDYH